MASVRPVGNQWVSFSSLTPKRAGSVCYRSFLVHLHRRNTQIRPINIRVCTVLFFLHRLWPLWSLRYPGLFSPECNTMKALHHTR